MVGIILLSFSMLLCVSNSHADDVLVHPDSRLVPVGTDFSLTCQIRTANLAYWIINDIEANSNYHSEPLARMGFFIERSVQENDIFILILRVNSSFTSVNNSRVFCTSVQVHSRTASILVISEFPIFPNPLIEQNSSTNLVLQWSPPFLWPGHSIEYYNISVRNSRDGSINFDRVNTTYSDAVVSFPFVRPEEENQCTEYIFEITAVKKLYDSGEKLQDVCVAGGFPNTHGEFEVAVNVLFKADGSPVLLIQIEIPPSICRYQEVNYTINVRTTEGEHIVMNLGPHKHRGHNSVTEKISSGLQRNQYYLLEVVLDTIAGNSTNYSPFNTSITVSHEDDAESTVKPCVHGLGTDSHVGAVLYVYKVSLGASLTAVVLLLFALICVSTSFLVHCKRRKEQENTQTSPSRVQRVMVHNPIYDGPMYESIQPRFESLTDNASLPAECSPRDREDSSVTLTFNSHILPASTFDSAKDQNSHQYVGQPQISPSTELPNKLSTPSALNQLPALEDHLSIPPSVNAPDINGMGMNKCRKDRNKLHLTLDLENIPQSSEAGDFSPSHNGEEKYQIMSPALAVNRSQSLEMAQIRVQRKECREM